MSLPARPQEQLIIDELANPEFESALCTTLGRGQLAIHLADRGVDDVRIWCLDLFLANQVKKELDRETPAVVCSSDMPTGEFDLIAIPTSMHGEAELTREFLLQSTQRLSHRGDWHERRRRSHAQPVLRAFP